MKTVIFLFSIMFAAFMAGGSALGGGSAGKNQAGAAQKRPAALSPQNKAKREGLRSSKNPKSREGAWRDRAIKDINAVHKIIKENHPGPLDRQNPSYNRQLHKNHRRALAKAGKAKTYNGWRYALQFFMNSFQDPKAGLSFISASEEGKLSFRWPSSWLWPGFIAAWRHQGWTVHFSDGISGSPKKGWKIISCDGKSLDDLMEANVSPFMGIKGLAADKIRFAPELFLDKGNPFVSRPMACLFDTGRGRQKIKLKWTALKFEDIKMPLRSAQGVFAAKREFSFFLKDGLA